MKRRRNNTKIVEIPIDLENINTISRLGIITPRREVFPNFNSSPDGLGIYNKISQKGFPFIYG